MSKITPPGPAVKTVLIETIPHGEQRYDTVGDYLFDPGTGTLNIFVSETGDWREAMTVALHELTESLLVIQRGVSLEAIDDFDKRFDGDEDEPGEQPDSPYREEHLSATVVERLIAFEIGLDWPTFEKNIYALKWEPTE